MVANLSLTLVTALGAASPNGACATPNVGSPCRSEISWDTPAKEVTKVGALGKIGGHLANLPAVRAVADSSVSEKHAWRFFPCSRRDQNMVISSLRNWNSDQEGSTAPAPEPSTRRCNNSRMKSCYALRNKMEENFIH